MTFQEGCLRKAARLREQRNKVLQRWGAEARSKVTVSRVYQLWFNQAYESAYRELAPKYEPMVVAIQHRIDRLELRAVKEGERGR